MTIFFTQWALWEKMTFCLGLAIVFAIILGFTKNLYARWRLRSYSTVDAQVLDPSPNMLESRIASSCAAPFGIRALESGVEIEGVWISGPNTPVASCPGSPLSSPAGSISSLCIDESNTTTFAVADLAGAATDSIQSSVQSWSSTSRRISDSGSVASWTIDSHGIKQAETYRPQPSSTPAANMPQASSHSHEPRRSNSSSADRTLKRTLTSSSDGNYKPRSSSTMPTSPTISRSNSERKRISQDHSSASTETTKGYLVEPEVDLRLLYSHRLSHVAETGQLIPRTKKSPVVSGEWPRMNATRDTRSRYPPISMNNRRVSKSLPTSPTSEKQDPFDVAAPNPSMTPSSVSVTNNRVLDSPTMDTSQAEPLSVRDDHDPVTVPTLPRDFYEQHSGAVSAIAMLSKPKAARSTSTNFEHERGSKVLRRVNDDFEILRAGTISDMQPEERVSRSRQETLESGKKGPRRLSKERPQANRDKNSFIEVLYGNERRPR
ncbi:hypothetical protein, variant 1 [Verruconis gallopava]|uniref:Uncharacterized protein n=1 Tax=Verruconis gallopava TaxID=253628 RepID=A0A0D1Z1W6_9PEZI|nr:hypothetical protein, variant 1 [Verruconis gallopava]KIW06922.1 hypothetical protein, variant 1 [Verruconis gallopava]